MDFNWDILWIKGTICSMSGSDTIIKTVSSLISVKKINVLIYVVEYIDSIDNTFKLINRIPMLVTRLSMFESIQRSKKKFWSIHRFFIMLWGVVLSTLYINWEITSNWIRKKKFTANTIFSWKIVFYDILFFICFCHSKQQKEKKH